MDFRLNDYNEHSGIQQIKLKIFELKLGPNQSSDYM